MDLRGTASHATHGGPDVGPVAGARAPAVAVAAAFDIPMTLPFRNVRARRGVLVRGPAGWGEWSPFPEYGPELTARWWCAAVEAATRPWPRPLRDEVAVNAIVPAVGPERAQQIVRESGCTTAKVKVGEGDDRARVEAVRDALGPHGRLRIDVNATWDVDTAVRRLRELAAYDLEYVEQPVADLRDFSRLRTKVDVPLAADEAVRLAPDPLHIPGIAAADVVILKVQPLGGVRRCLAVAEAAGRPAVVSSAVETSVGLAAGLALAAALPDLAGACGLGTLSLLAGDITADPLRPVGGRLRVRRPTPDPALLERWSAAPAVTEQLYARLAAARAAAER
jgi:o-succinylbenzoate synthase